jgi:hypothetical protein
LLAKIGIFVRYVQETDWNIVKAIETHRSDVT